MSKRSKMYLGNTFSINLHNSDMKHQTKGLDGCMHILIRKENENNHDPGGAVHPVLVGQKHTELDAMIRVYNTTVWQITKRKRLRM